MGKSSLTHCGVKDLQKRFKRMSKEEIEEVLAKCEGDTNKCLTELVRLECSKIQQQQQQQQQEQQQQQQQEQQQQQGTVTSRGAPPSPTGADSERGEYTLNPRAMDFTSTSEVAGVSDYVPPSARSAEIQPPVEHNGFKRALLIGINYTGTQYQLTGCIPDTERIKEMLTTLYHFEDSLRSMVVLTDDRSDNPLFLPTRRNICNAIEWLTKDCKPGDALFFSFSGHGAQIPAKGDYEVDGLDETILPSDWQEAGMIVDYDLHRMLVSSVPANVRLTVFMDCCHSGTVIDLPFVYNVKNDAFMLYQNPYYSEGDCVLFSGCRDAQTSADVTNASFGAGGAMTMAFLQAVMGDPYNITYKQLMNDLRSNMKKNGFPQEPMMSATQNFSARDVFSLTDIHGQNNDIIGQGPPGEWRGDGPPPSSSSGMMTIDEMIAAAAASSSSNMSPIEQLLTQLPICAPCVNQNKTTTGGLDFSTLLNGGIQNFDTVVDFVVQQIKC